MCQLWPLTYPDVPYGDYYRSSISTGRILGFNVVDVLLLVLIWGEVASLVGLRCIRPAPAQFWIGHTPE